MRIQVNMRVLCADKQFMAFVVSTCFYFSAEFLHVSAALFLVVLIRKDLIFLCFIF